MKALILGSGSASVLLSLIAAVSAQSCPTITASSLPTNCSLCASRTIYDAWKTVTVPCGCPSDVPKSTTRIPCPSTCAGAVSYTAWYTSRLCPSETSTTTPSWTTTTTTASRTTTLIVTDYSPISPPWNCPTITSTVLDPTNCLKSTSRVTITAHPTTTRSGAVCDIFSSVRVPCGCPSVVPRRTVTDCVRSCGTAWVISTATNCNMPPSTTTSSTTASTAAPGVLKKWDQCGGLYWGGSGTCVVGTKCIFINDWYSQCL